MRILSLFAALLAIAAGTSVSYGLAMEQIGPDKDRDHKTFKQPWWADGRVEIHRHDARVYSVDVNGNENLYFKATPGEVGTHV